MGTRSVDSQSQFFGALVHEGAVRIYCQFMIESVEVNTTIKCDK